MRPWGEITAGEILPAIRGTLLSGNRETVIHGICTDSRILGPGDLFWALEGERYDGHAFVAAALKKGAAGVVIRRALLRQWGYGAPAWIHKYRDVSCLL